MKRHSFWLILIVLTPLLARCTSEPDPEPIIVYPESISLLSAFFPVMAHQPFPFCERQDSLGIAWLDNSPAGAQEDLDNFCGSLYYNSSGGDYSFMHPNEVPIIWGNSPAHLAAAASIPDSYCGPVLTLNEPGTHGQFHAPTPEDAARAYMDIDALLPSCALRIGPNLIIQSLTASQNSVAYLEGFIREVERLRGGKANLTAVGIHFYGAEWIATSVKVGWVADAMESLGYQLPIWITEAGVFPGNGAQAEMRDIVKGSLNHPDVDMILGYTVRNTQGGAIPWVLGPRGFESRLSPSGKGWFTALYDLGMLQ